MIKSFFNPIWAIVIALILAGVTIKYLYDKNQELDNQLNSAKAMITAKTHTITTIKAQLEKVQQLDTKLTQELHHANQKIDVLERDLANNTKRVYVNATCPTTVPNQPAATGVVNERTCELTATARTDYLHLRRELERAKAQISGLQGYIRALPGECVQGSDKTDHL